MDLAGKTRLLEASINLINLKISTIIFLLPILVMKSIIVDKLASQVWNRTYNCYDIGNVSAVVATIWLNLTQDRSICLNRVKII